MKDDHVEVWKECHYLTDYDISSLGRIRKIKSKKILKTRFHGGRHQFSIRKNKKLKEYTVHKLMAYTFFSNYDGSTISFLNNDKTDIRLCNLKIRTTDTINDEIWKDLYCSSDYQISNKGRVRNKNFVLKSKLTKLGYINIKLFINGVQSTFRIHRLVMLTFKSNEYFEGAVVNHINGIKTDNNIDNLEWCTPKENSQHATKNNKYLKGESVSISKLTDDLVKQIRSRYKIINNYAQISREFNIGSSTAWSVINKRTWRHVE